MRTRYTIALSWLLVLSCTVFVLNMGTTRSAASSTHDLQTVLSLTNSLVAQNSYGQSLADRMNAPATADSAAASVRSPGSNQLTSAQSNIDQYIEVAHEIDPRLGKLLTQSCSDGEQDPVELERMIRRYGRGLVALADLQTTDRVLYERKIEELHLDAETNAIAAQLRRSIEVGGPNSNESIQLRTSLEVLMRSKLVLSMSNRERSLEKLNERIRSLRDRLDYEEANFDEELGRQMDQLMHQLDPVQAARGK